MSTINHSHIHQNSFQLTRSEGFTLVEIMLAITLSLILIAGVVQVYLSSKTSFHVQNQLARLQENQRIAVDFLQRDIQQAGFAPLGDPPISFNQRIAVTNNANGADDGEADSITIRYTSATDCLGAAIPPDANGRTIAVNTYTVNQATQQLMCAGNGNANNPQPIADGISDMQILLGENDRQNELSTYADQLKSADRYVNVDALDNMNKVVSVRIALLSRSEQNIRPEPVVQQFTLLDTVTNTNDRIKRQIVTTTIPLRN